MGADRLPETWEQLEDLLEEELRQAQKKQPLAYLRLFDSKSAGNFLPAQPSDFLAAHKGRTTLVEAKFSEVHSSLKSCFSNVSANQTASARIWTRAQCCYIVLFYSLEAGHAEVWDGAYLFQRRAARKRLELSKRRIYPTPQIALARELGYTRV